MSDNLIVRLTVVGHASKRWLGARSQAEAERLNQQLSEARAQNLRKPVEDIIKRELPGVKIEVPATGVGSHEGFPLAGENNAAIDRSVVVMIELTTTHAGSRTEFRPRKLYVPSKFWELEVVAMVDVSGGIDGTFMRIVIRNAMSGHKLTLAGYLFGGYLDPKNPFHFGSKHPPNPNDTLKPVGNKVTFTTKEAEDFDFFIGSENGQWVRVVHAGVGVIRKRETTFLQFTGLDTHPSSLVFEYKKGWALPTLNISVVTGILKVEGPVPSDFVDDTKMVTVPTQDVHHNYDGLLLSFPTGEAGLHDLTSKDQQRLTDFVTNKARAIAALASDGFTVGNPP
ncbi:MAG: hypothetical protein WA459_15360 [Stellaceae bacterium]